MEIAPEQYEHIGGLLPRQRGTARFDNLAVLNAILYEHGCKWRGLPERFGNWHTIYTRMSRWLSKGVLDRIFVELKVHPDGAGALKKTVRKPSVSPGADGAPRFIWLPRMPARP